MERSKTTEALMEQFPREAHKQRTGGGGRQFTYLEAHSYIHRLIDVTDNEWDWEIKSFQVLDGVATVVGKLTIQGLGSRDGIGVQAIMPGKQGTEDLIKGASSDAIKAASKLFGIGLYLYGADYEGEEDAKPAPPARPTQPAPPQRPAPQNRPAPGKPAPPPLTLEEKELLVAKSAFAKSVSKFFGGEKVDPVTLWGIFTWLTGTPKKEIWEVEFDEWLGAAEDLDFALSPIKNAAIRQKRGELSMPAAIKVATDAKMLQSLFIKLHAATSKEEVL